MKTQNNPIFNCPVIGYANHRIILDDTGKAIDYEFLEVNTTFERLTGLKKENLINHTVREAIPGIENSEFDWIGFYGQIALYGGEKEFEQYSKELKKWYSVYVYSTEKMTFITVFVDITTSKIQAEELEAFFSVNLDLLCIADLQGNFIKTNKAWSSILGYSSDELNKRKFLEFVHPDDLQSTLNAMSNLSKGEEVLNFVNRYICKDGSYRYIEWRSQPQGNLIYAAARDITEHIKSEETLKKQAGLINSLLDSTPDLIFYKDNDGVYIGCNPSFAEFAGRKREDIIGKTDYELFSKEVADFFRYNDKEMLKQKKSRNNEEWITYPDGRKILIDTLKTPYYDINESTIGVLGISRDITKRKVIEEELRQSEENFRIFFNSIDDFLFVLDEEGKINSVNETVTKRLGYSESELAGNSVLFVHPENRREEAGKTVMGMLEGTVDFCPVPLQTKTGELIQVETRVYPGQWNGKPALFGVTKDITRIKQSEERFSKAFQAGTALMAISEMETGRFIDVNDEFLRVTGYKKEEIIGKSSLERNLFFDPNDRERILKSVKESGTAKNLEVKIRMASGDIRIGLFSVSQIEIGNTACWLTTMVDITDRKNIEEELKLRESYLSTILENQPGLIWLKDSESSFLAANTAFAKSCGIGDPKLLKGKNDFDIWPKELAEKYRADDFEVMASGNSKIVEEIIFDKGDAKWFETFKSPISDVNGKIIGTTGYSRDISLRKKMEIELKHSEEQLRLTFDVTGEGIWDWNISENTVQHNKAWCNILGIGEEKLLHNLEFFSERIHPEDKDKVFEKVDYALKTGTKYESQHRLMKMDGSIIWVSDRGAVVENDESGNPLRMLGSISDITDKKIIEEQLIKAKQQAEAASKAKSQFLANMSHEIRTPLNGVIGFTELLKGTPLSPIQEQYVNNANVAGHSLLGIINDILDFSKIEAGMLYLEMIKTDMIELLENSADIIKYSAGKKNLELMLHIDPAMPRFAVTDPIRLKQILANLLGNAVKFTEKGEVELKVIYKPLSDGKGRLSFFVRDTGIGIAEEQQRNIFKSFTQADSSTTRKFGGTGLGLIISDLIANKMGSRIHIDSTPGKGSVFYFDIITEVENGQKIDKSSINKIKHCLIIDDNANNRLILEEMLTHYDIYCESCDNGLSALKLLETSRHFDIIICDYHMPYLDGIETIRLIREKLKLTPEKQPVILLHSSSDDAELHRKCDELGVRFRLTKPVKSADLFSYLYQIQNPEQSETEFEYTSHNEIEYPELQNKNLKILIAEDVAMNMLMIKAMLQKLCPGTELIEAINGLEVVKLYEDNAPDLIFMDVQMPELDGFDATRKIRSLEQESGKHVPIVALTAGAFKEEQEKCLAAGMDDFLTKPVEPQKIKTVLNKYLAAKLSEHDTIHFRKETLLERTGSEDFVNKLVAITLSDFPSFLKNLNTSIQERNYLDIRKTVHQIKGVASNMGFLLITEIAAAMEESAASQKNYSFLKEKYYELEKEWEVVQNILVNYV